MYSSSAFLTFILALKLSVLHTTIKTKWPLMAHPAKTRKAETNPWRYMIACLDNFNVNTVHFKFVSRQIECVWFKLCRLSRIIASKTDKTRLSSSSKADTVHFRNGDSSVCLTCLWKNPPTKWLALPKVLYLLFSVHCSSTLKKMQFHFTF